MKYRKNILSDFSMVNPSSCHLEYHQFAASGLRKKIWRMITKVAQCMVLTVMAMQMIGSAACADERVMSYSPGVSEHISIPADTLANARSRLPMLTDASQLPAETRKILKLDEQTDVSPQACGCLGHPFTTKRSGAAATNKTKIMKKAPWSGIGKLIMRFGEQWYVCSASVIDRGLVVTAAHCVHNFGLESYGWADEVIFEPGRHKNHRPMGKWRAKEYWIPTVYWNGTDTCTVPGVVCENDIAILVMKKKLGKFIGKKSHIFDYGINNYSYTDFLGETVAQITQMGYPADLDEGRQMIRTDSLGYQASPSNVVIGSDQAGGSSGGPWIVNFGKDYQSYSSIPTAHETRVVGVTSWGYNDCTVKVQGASRFSTNTSFPTMSNFEVLHAGVCASWPDYCNQP